MIFCARAETLEERIANSEKIYFVKLMPTKILVQFKNYNQPPDLYEPSFFEDKIHPMEIVSFKQAYDEMRFIYENEMGAAELECEVVVDGNIEHVEIKSIEDFVDTLKIS